MTSSSHPPPLPFLTLFWFFLTFSTDEFISIGLKMLDTLIEEGYYLPVLRIIANITPQFFQLKKPLLANPQ